MTGYEGRTNTLNLFDLDTVDESVIGDGISFDKKDIAKEPDSVSFIRMIPMKMVVCSASISSTFMVSAGAQLILEECA